MTLHHYHFDRDKSIEIRIRENAPDPFFVRVFDFNLPGIVTPDRLAALVAWLVGTHDAFRTCLQFDAKGELCARLYEGAPPPLHIEEVGNLAAQAEGREQFLARNYQRIDLFRGPLAEFHYYRSSGENKSLLRILCSHFASDQQTYRLLVERLVGFFSAGGPAKVEAGSYLDWMDAYWNYASSGAGIEELKFWEAVPREPFARARSLMPATTDGGAQKITLTLSDDVLAALQAKCRLRWRCRPVEAIVVALGVAVGREFGLEDVPLNWSAHGRFPLNRLGFTHTAGWLSGRHPLLVPVGSERKTELALGFRNALLRIPTWGSSFTWVTRFCGRKEALDLEPGLKSPVTINVQESPRLSPAKLAPVDRSAAPAAFTVEPVPSSDLHYPIYCLITLGRLTRITFYSQGNLLAAPAERVMRSTRANLDHYAFREADDLTSG